MPSLCWRKMLNLFLRSSDETRLYGLILTLSVAAPLNRNCFPLETGILMNLPIEKEYCHG